MCESISDTEAKAKLQSSRYILFQDHKIMSKKVMYSCFLYLNLYLPILTNEWIPMTLDMGGQFQQVLFELKLKMM